MYRMKNNSKMWLIPLLLVMLNSCEDRVGITSLPVTTTPTVSSTNPANNETGVPFNQKIAATFSEAMESASITTASFTLMKEACSSCFVSGTVSFTGTTATFAPLCNLEPNTAYIATITTMAKNLAGIALANNYVWSFTTGAAAAVTSPTVSSTNPVNAETGVPLNQKIAATFSVAMDATTISASTFIIMQGTTPIPGFVSYSGTTAIFAPSSNLAPNTAYTATITTGAKDLAGNALANNYVWSFTTGAAVVVTPPTVISTDPANAETGVALNQKIAATFSRTMDATTITTSTFTLMQGATSISGFVSYSGKIATFSPASNLAPNTTYTATITTGAKDLAGIALANNYVWSFTTGAAVVVTPPTVIFTDPANVETGVALNQKIAATFSKTMDAATLTTATFTLRQGLTSISGFVSYVGTTATFSPASNLLPNSTYTATITTGAEDLAGNALEDDYVWSFTTGAAVIVTPPTVISTDPANDATGVSLNQKVSATFSKTMDATTITTSTFTLMDGTTSISGFVSYSGKTAIFSPASNLESYTEYTATITTGAEDLAGNALEDDYEWSFTTGAAVVVTPPTVISTDPANHAIGVALGKQIAATFSKAMDASTITTSTFTLKKGSTSISGFVSYSGTTAIFSPASNLESDTEYTATITTGAKDLEGISMTNSYVWSFKTAVPNYSVTLSRNPSEGGNASGDGIFDSGSTVTVTATVHDGYTFDNWTENGTVVSTNAIYQFVISKDRTLVANFTAIQLQYTVSLSRNPSEGGNTSGDGTFDAGSTVTVTATVNAGYTFTNWTENGIDVHTNAIYQFEISKDRTLVANFTSLPSGPPSVSLGSARDFAALAGSGVSNTGATTHLYGDVGSHPTPTIAGLTEANVTGTLYTAADPVVAAAKTALNSAYGDAQSRSLDAISLPGQLGGLTLAPGLYVNSSSSGISGTGSNAILTLDAGGNPNAVWIFKMGSSLVTTSGTSIVLAGGARWRNIFWAVGSSATLGTNSTFYGNILADQSITLTTGARLYGRALTRVAAVTLDSNLIDNR